ncbi:MAG: hypothetical protein ACJAUP_003582 [Cellvibrionaceae bacterium]|jgi:hypothetical protein
MAFMNRVKSASKNAKHSQSISPLAIELMIEEQAVDAVYK